MIGYLNDGWLVRCTHRDCIIVGVELASVSMDGMYRSLRDTIHRHGPECVEFEYRLGTQVINKFLPGVSRESWDLLKRSFDAATCWGSKHHSVTTEHILRDKKLVDKPTPHFVDKKRVSHHDVAHGTHVIRAAVSLERTSESNTPCKDPVMFVRHKDRYSYVWQCWRYDLTRVKSNAPEDLDNENDIYEVELEFYDPMNYYLVPMPEIPKWGLDIMRDVSALVASA